MMGPSHALSGAALWLAGTLAAERLDLAHLTPVEVATGTLVCAGAALLPDLDMSGAVIRGKGGATIANTFGRASLFLAEIVEKVSLGVYHLTSTGRDPGRDNGHRTLTHTLPFCATAGALTWWGTHAGGPWATIVVLVLTTGLAIRGLTPRWAGRVGWLVITTSSLAAGYGLHLLLDAGRAPYLLGAAVGAGCVIHLLGDIITRAGVPILWPIKIRGQRWRMIGIPNSLAVECGGTGEQLLRAAFTVVSMAAVVGLIIQTA